MGKMAKTSRKGKKAWRANISTEDIHEFFDKSTKEAQSGGSLKEASSDSLFFVDKSSDLSVKRKIEKNREKVLWRDSILQPNPFVKPVASQTLRKVQKKPRAVPSAEVAAKNGSENGAASSSGVACMWTSTAETDSKGKKIRKTSIIPAVEVEPAGCSFNPPFESHQDSLAHAVAEEMQKVYRNELGPLPVPVTVPGEAIADEDKYFLDADVASNDEGSENSEPENMDEDGIIRPKKKKRVTRVELNKRARRKEVLKKESEVKKVKELAKEIDSLPIIIKEIEKEDKEKEKRHTRRVVAKQERLKVCPPRLGKRKFEPAPTQVLLSEEITGSLRKLKACCTLTRDRFKSFEKRGLIVPTARSSRLLPAVTAPGRLIGITRPSRSKQFTLLARYSQAQDIFTSRLQDSIQNLPKLVEDIVQTSINTGPRGAVRLAQGIQAVIGVGSEWLAEVSASSSSSAQIPTQLQLGLLSPVYLRKLFERMGATYIKLGQFIASAPTLFPSEYAEEFQKCFDRAPPVPFEYIKKILREELGQPIDSVFDYVDPTPLASASIAQVHVARLRGVEEDVVIKVLKPGIEDILVADLNFIYVVARIFEFLNPELSRASLVGIVNDIRASMLEEVDFNKEAANIESFRRYLVTMGLTRQATAPKVFQQFSSRRVLTMERLYGVPITDLNSISSFVSNPKTSLITALNVWFGSLLACETFHADVHAGNLWQLRDGRIGFLDFGIVGRISPKTWAAMEVFLASLATEEYDSMASALIEMGATNTNVDANAFSRDLQKIFSSIQNLDTELVVAAARGPNATAISANITVDERQMNALFLDVVRVSESYGLRFPREFALLMKQLLYFDRYTRLLAPNINMLQDQRISIASNRRTSENRIYK
ncbi:unnamed protein product [Rhodiola kirilowii]